ncbi:hypothetical protein ACHAXN_002258 [Cyclotella atomus]
MYHGGTIFRDAASKYIHVENQVSLGDGDTTVAKLKVEEWLWEQARVSIQHYHSDNGVFQAEIFTEACKEAHQTQSFSGVGAQHQNAEAERAIQTVMYMARSFRFSGITPIEMVTRCKSDHRDLLRTHVWGCPVYVLDPKLQNGKKLPKWNRCARLGQFLGYSRQHIRLRWLWSGIFILGMSAHSITSSLMTNSSLFFMMAKLLPSWMRFVTHYLSIHASAMWRRSMMMMVCLFTSRRRWVRFG